MPFKKRTDADKIIVFLFCELLERLKKTLKIIFFSLCPLMIGPYGRKRKFPLFAWTEITKLPATSSPPSAYTPNTQKFSPNAR